MIVLIIRVCVCVFVVGVVDKVTITSLVSTRPWEPTEEPFQLAQVIQGEGDF